MKHFEELWEAAEKISDELKQDLASSFSAAAAHLEILKTCPQNMQEYHMGMLIFNIASVSRILDINTYSALQKITSDKKSETLDP